MNSRITGFDWVRVIAAFTIVAFHIVPYRGIVNELAFSWAVPFFFALSGFLNGRCDDYDEGQWLAKRLTRIAIPYAIWTTLRLVDLKPITPVTLAKQYLLCSPTSTLWFLWTLMLCVGLVWLMRRVLSLETVAAISVGLGLGYAAVCQWWQSFGVVGAWLHANPGYALQMPFLWMWVYACAMLLVRAREAARPLSLAILAAGFVLLFVGRSEPALAYNFSWGIQGIVHGLWGLGIMLLASVSDLPRSPKIEHVAAVSLGIYLVHPAVIRVLRMAAAQLPAALWLTGHTVVFWAIVSVLSLGISLALYRWRITRWAVA